MHSAKCPRLCMAREFDQVCEVHGGSYAHSSAQSLGRDRSSNCSSLDFPGVNLNTLTNSPLDCVVLVFDLNSL